MSKHARANGSAEMFNSIAGRYDLLNRLLSLGMDGSWRRRAVRAMECNGRGRLLDVAAGTADLAREMAARSPGARIVATDPALGMLRIGRSKLRGPSPSGLLFAGADAQNLPFADDSFDAAGIAFGIRNVPDRVLGLKEMCRVVRPGGRVVVLELARPRGSLLAPFARAYVRWIVPLIGAVVSSATAYRYLRTSMERFPTPEEFLDLMRDAGLRDAEWRPLFPGACHLYAASVPDAEDPT